METETLEKITNNKEQRMLMAEQSLEFFTVYYLAHYIQYPSPDIHKDIYLDLENDEVRLMELIAFRGSAKSTLASLALPLWSAIFKKRNFIILCSDTSAQTGQIIRNIIFELETNPRIKEDFGTFDSRKKTWTSTNIVLNNDVQIIARSTGQQVRGLRFMENRPDLIVCDDVENVENVKTKEQRDKTQEWFLSDVLPSVDQTRGKVLLVGSLLHSDSLLARIKDKCKKDNLGTLKEYPLLDEKGVTVWEEMYPAERIKELRKQDERFFRREYLLEIVPDEGTIVEKVHYYTDEPKLRYLAVGTDLAISEKQTADFTAFNVCGQGHDGKIYNLHSFKKRMSFNDTLAELNKLYLKLKMQYAGLPILLGWEDVGYQRAGMQEATRRYKMPIKPIKRDKDKRSRLHAIEPHISTGQVLYREKEDVELVIEILHFGVEAHDDLMDAHEMAVQLLLTRVSPSISWV
jgi:predicted phage terminase large subunit-like protein